MKKDVIEIIIYLILFIFLLWAYPALAQVNASWEPSERATGYKLYFGTSSRDYVDYVTVYDTQVQIPLARFERERIYFFTLTAFNNYGESGFGNEVSLFIITGIEEVVLDFKDCNKIKTYNIRGQEVKSDRLYLPSGFYIRRCFVGGEMIWTKSEILIK